MAMLQLRNLPHLANNLSRFSYEAHQKVYHKHINALHVSSIRRYPSAPELPLPTNVSEIFANETGRFTPERSRDITTSVFLYGGSSASSFSLQQTKQSFNQRSFSACDDTHIDSYDCFGAVSLNGTMQSNVPKPFCSGGKSTHFNMPGGQWARDGKYIAEHMQKSHYRIMKLHNSSKSDKNGSGITNIFSQTIYQPRYINSMNYSTDVSKSSKIDPETAKSKKELMKLYMRIFGYSFIVIHIVVSLTSLGVLYAAVASGFDVKPYIEELFKHDHEKVSEILNSLQYCSTFAIAYLIHKALAPVRLAISMTVTPFVVRPLRKIGILKARDP